MFALGFTVGPVPPKPPVAGSWRVSSHVVARLMAALRSADGVTVTSALNANAVASASASTSLAQPRVDTAGAVAS